MSGRIGSRVRVIAFTVTVGVLVLALVLAGNDLRSRRGVVRGPAAPYDHGGLSEISVARDGVLAGQAGVVAAGLTARGYWCVEPRRNDVAVQIACSSPTRDARVDMVAGPGGDLRYANLRFGPIEAPFRDYGNQALKILDDSFLKLWPQDRAAVQDLLESAQPHPFMPFGRDAPPTAEEDQYTTHEKRTDSASWSLWSRYDGRPLELRVRTTGLTDRSWPFGGSHYATSIDAATAALERTGFVCRSSCHRVSDDQDVDFDQHDGQIVTARFSLRSRSDDTDRTDPSGRWVRAGLVFLGPAVRDAVGRRVERSRIEQRSWHGVVAGTPVDITAHPRNGTTPEGVVTSDVHVAIGIPLLDVE